KDREFLVLREDRLQGQHDAADLTAGGNASQRPRFLAEVCRDVEFDGLMASLRCGESPAVQMDPSIRIFKRAEANLEPAVGHPQLRAFLFDRLFDPRGGLLSAVAQLASQCG